MIGVKVFNPSLSSVGIDGKSSNYSSSLFLVESSDDFLYQFLYSHVSTIRIIVRFYLFLLATSKSLYSSEWIFRK